MSWTTGAVSNLARKFDFLQDRAQRRPIREVGLDIPSDPAKRNSIGHLKEFYLQRLAKAEPAAAARLGAGTQGALTSGELGQDALISGELGKAPYGTNQVCRPTFSPGAVEQGGEDLEIMCNNCFTLIRSSEAAEHGNTCFINLNRAGANTPGKAVAVLDTKLAKLRSALEARLQDAGSKVNVMRHLTQLRYHIDTATKWVPGCSEIGALSDHTVQQVKQLTATSRVLAPAVYIFSKRIENVIVQKERELRKGVSSLAKASSDGLMDTLDVTTGAMSLADASSIVSEMDSDCGTQYPETVVSQGSRKTDSADVGNVQDANDYLSLKNEDEQRRWFYSQCLTVKLSCPNQARARRTLISDLYSKVKAESVPIEGWVEWIRGQLAPDEDEAGGIPAAFVQQEMVAAAGDKAAGGPMPLLGLSSLTTAAGTPTPSGSGTKLPTMFHAGAATARSAVSSTASIPTGGSMLSARSVNDTLGPTRPVLSVGSGARVAPASVTPQRGGGVSAGDAVAARTVPGASSSVVPSPQRFAGTYAGGVAGQTQPANGYTTYVRPQGGQGMPPQYAHMAQGGGLNSQAGAARS